MFGICVVNCGVQPAYFLDEITPVEVNALLNQYFENYKNGWEQTRFISYIIASCNSTKELKVTDIIEFSWDKVIEAIPDKKILINYQNQLIEATKKNIINNGNS